MLLASCKMIDLGRPGFTIRRETVVEAVRTARVVPRGMSAVEAGALRAVDKFYSVDLLHAYLQVVPKGKKAPQEPYNPRVFVQVFV